MSKILSDEYIGCTVSDGTCVTKDLIEALLSFLESHAEECEIAEFLPAIREESEAHKLTLKCFAGYNGSVVKRYLDKASEALEYILHENIWPLMDDIAPAGTSFCGHEGDGALFGFWPYPPDEFEWSESEPEALVLFVL